MFENLVYVYVYAVANYYTNILRYSYSDIKCRKFENNISNAIVFTRYLADTCLYTSSIPSKFHIEHTQLEYELTTYTARKYMYFSLMNVLEALEYEIVSSTRERLMTRQLKDPRYT